MTEETTPPSAAGDSNIQPPNMFSLGGDCGRVLGEVDWSRHVLGPIWKWPQSLVTALSICLSSRYPICILWGSKRIYFYNDAYAPIVGAKHPAALARGYPEVWPEIWDTIRPILERVELTGESSWSDNLLLVLQRHGFNEECYFAFSFAPVRVEDGSVGGVFTAITETTAQVVGERRLRALRELGAAATDSRTIEGAIELAARVVAQCSHDVPFALFYQTVGDTAHLAGFAGADSVRTRLPVRVNLMDSAEGELPFAQAMQAGDVPPVIDLSANFGLLNSGPWPEAIDRAVIMPIRRPGESVPYGFFVAGLSPRRPWDDEYRNFLSLLNNQVAASIANAVAYTEERARSERLREVDRAKTAFFSNVSHEFRTPLTLMLGPLEEEMRDSPAPRERLQVVHRNSLRLLKLVNTLLDFSRMEAGRNNAVYQPTDLATYTSELASAFRSATDKAGLRLIVECPPLSELVYLDRSMWEKIVFNLLSNALKFTFEGEIEIKLSEGPGVGGPAHDANGAPAGQICLSVRDTGTGIPAAELPRVFERFHRVQNARSRSHEGTGIGLALVAELARLHGGTVRVESTEGIGTTFFVSIAKGTSHLPRESIQSGDAKGAAGVSPAAFIEEVLQWLPGDPIRESPVATTASPLLNALQPSGRDGGARPTILLADDNRDMREYVSRLLIAQGYDVEAVTDGQAALEAISRRLPSLVLSDVMMPGMNGFELLQRVRSNEALRTLPIILLSARAGEEARVEGAAQGADDYLTKPFSARELLARVAVHLELARVRREAAQTLRESEAQQSFLLRMGDALRLLADPVEIQATASRILGEHLGASRVVYFEVRGADYFVARDYVNGVAALAGGYPIASFGERLLATYRDGQTACSRDFAADLSLSPAERAAYAAIHVGAHVAVPLVKAGEFVAGLAVHSREPRDWTAGEISLVEKTAERTWEAVQRARADAALRQARQRFDIVKDSTRVGFWFCDLPFDKLEWDDRVKEHFWLPPDAEVTINTFYERMHPEDREPTRRAIEFSIANKSHYETEFRTASPDAQVKWVRAIGRGFYGSEGEPVRFDGVTLDITESKRARELLQDSEARLREGRERLQAALNGSGAGTFRWNIQTNVLEWDENLDRLFGLPPGQTIRSLEKFLSVVHPAERPGVIERCNRCAREGANFDMEFRIVWPDGSIRWLRDQGATYRDVVGQPFYVTGMCLDITESKQAEETLRTAKELAEAASRAKDEFLAALSHELRTPLTPVLMTAAALKDDPRLSEDIREELGMMERNIALEARLIDDLLDLTAISHGKLTLHLEPCDLNTLVKQVMEMVTQDAGPKNLEITCEFGAQQPGLRADPTRLQQVIWNLLRNAVKFTPPGGKISVCTRGTRSPEGNPWLTLEIADTGIGIEAAHIAKIFQPFDQGALSGSHRFGGLGLGLAIAHAVVISHGGRIHVRSEGAGRGATFVVDLPHAVPAAATLASPASLRGPSPPAKLASLRLLLVEDHESTLQTLARLLRRDGHHVTTTTTIAGAQTAATQETFDLVISDLGLPDGGGTKLMEKLRSSYGLRGIALSGYGMQEDIDRSREAGFVAHLVKPVAISDLRRTLEEVSRI